MSKTHVLFMFSYLVALGAAYFIKVCTLKVAKKAIKDERLSTGIFAIFPVEGKKAVELAKGYIRGSKIFFWFVVVFFPVMYVLFFIQGSI